MLMAFPDREIGEVLLGAEQRIRLIDRVAPRNLQSERERLTRELTAGRNAEPRFEYGPVPDLARTRDQLIQLAASLDCGGVIGRLYAARALELESEAALITAVGQPRFTELARLRFDPGALWPSDGVEALLQAWLAAAPGEAEVNAGLVASDDELHPDSLLNVLRRRIGVSRQPIRIEVRPDLPTVAAAGNDVVRIRPAVLLTAPRARRIALHELEAHVFPRCAARRQRLAMFRCGTRLCAEHEEGRALLIEERAGLLDAARRRELALRHRAAEATRLGAPFSEVVRLLREQGATLTEAVEMGLRAGRGGGLGREIVYVPAYLRVGAEFSKSPELERPFELGRVSLDAARVLVAAESSSSSLATGS